MKTEQQLALDFDRARALRDAGMQQAVDHADQVSPTWSERALAFVYTFALARQRFTSEDVREYAHANGLPVAPDNRAWGSIMRQVGVKGYARRTSELVAAKDPKVHMNEIRVWESRIFRG